MGCKECEELQDLLAKCKDCKVSQDKKRGIPEKENIEVTVITTEENKLMLLVGDEILEIADYKVQSSAYGETELCVTIKGKPVSTELLTNSVK